MKLPEIKTRNKVRDAKICNLYLRNELNLDEIGAKFGISGRQVSRILYKNASVLKLDKEWEKVERIQWLKKQIKTKGDSKKDTADLQLQLKEELEETNITKRSGVAIQIISYGQNTNPSASVQRPDTSVAIRDFSEVRQ